MDAAHGKEPWRSETTISGRKFTGFAADHFVFQLGFPVVHISGEEGGAEVVVTSEGVGRVTGSCPASCGGERFFLD